MIVDLAAQRAMDHLKKVGFDRLSEAERILATVWQFAAGVANHGFASYYGSRRADLAFHAPAALRAIGAEELATIAAAANAQFGPDGPSSDPKVRAEQLRQFGEPVFRAFDSLEQRYFDAEESVDALFEAWFERQKTASRSAA
ncbi:MAG: DUF4375 domain-containing protein [Opitutaceae bacterium]|nr:DUF4375 domain-containing protein [Opitutaceae bacterium]